MMKARTEARCFLVSKDMVIPLPEGEAIVLGRDPTMDNYVLPDERVSRGHAIVFFKDSRFYVKDLKSSNGTFVNKERISSARQLSPGDVVEIRPFRLEFVEPGYEEIAEAGEQEAGDGSGHNKLNGSLDAISVTDLIQLLNSTQQSGVLIIRDAEGIPAEMTLFEGDVIRASCRGERGELAAYAAMAIRRGRFEFTKGSPSLENREINRRTPSLLLEGCRRLDEETSDTRKIPENAHTRIVPVASAGPGPESR